MRVEVGCPSLEARRRILTASPDRTGLLQGSVTSEIAHRDGGLWHALDKGMQHVYIKPRTPRLNGKVERSHRIDAEEFYRLLAGVVIDDTNLFNDKLREWEDYYNYHRPHGGLGGQTPYERLRQKTHTQV